MKQYFKTQRGPKAIGPYSTAVIRDGICYLSGMIPVDPACGRITAEDIGGQARQVFENVRTVLEELNASTSDILKTTVFLTDLGDFAAVNEIYAAYFGPDYPARSCVQVSALPAGARIEMEAVASVDRE
ncbi:MAG: reactive intermediate/imine deaminase [Clostridia bacterium]|nr:reactive intermediate/imine deaminase [Clostridia bacterium]